MIQPDRDGNIPCGCGRMRHFAKPCPHCAGPNPAVLPPPGVAVGASDAVQRRMEADGARTAASGPQRLTVGQVAVLPPHPPLQPERLYGPDETMVVVLRGGS